MKCFFIFGQYVPASAIVLIAPPNLSCRPSPSCYRDYWKITLVTGTHFSLYEHTEGSLSVIQEIKDYFGIN